MGTNGYLMQVTQRTNRLKRPRTNASGPAAAKRLAVFGPTSFVTAVARLFPAQKQLADSLRGAVGRGNMDAAQTAVFRLMMTTNKVNTTAQLLGLWRGYQDLQKLGPTQGVASKQLQNFQRQFGRRNLGRPRSDFDRLPGNIRTHLLNASAKARPPGNVQEQILKLLNAPAKAKLATAFGIRVPDPHNMKELGDIIYAAAKLSYASWDITSYTKRYLTKHSKEVLGSKNFTRFRVKYANGDDDEPIVLLRGTEYEASVFIGLGELRFEVRNTKGHVFVFEFHGQGGWGVNKQLGGPVPNQAKSVIRRELQRAHMARPRNFTDNNDNRNRNMYNLPNNNNNNNANRPIFGPHPRRPAVVMLRF